MKRGSLILLLFLTVPLWGQRPTTAETSHMNIRLLNTLDEYSRTCSLSDKDDIRVFLRLFEDPDRACLYNDILGTTGFQNQLSPRAYSDLLDPDTGNVLRTEISRIRKMGDYFQEAGSWHRRVSLHKYLMLIDASVYSGPEGGILFDSDLLYGSDPGFSLVLDLVYDADSDRMLIASIELQERKPSIPLDQSSFTVVLRPDNVYAEHLLTNGMPLTFNEFGQAIVENGSLNTDDDDVVLRFNTMGSSSLYTVLEPVFKKYHFRFKPHYSMTLKDAFRFTTQPSSVPFAATSKAMEAGLDLGFVMGRPSLRSRILLYLGAAYSSSLVDMSAGPFEYRYGVASPIHYSIQSVKESLQFREIAFPAYFELEASLGSRIGLAFDVGGKFYLNQRCEVAAPFHADGSVSVAGGSASPFSADFDRFVAPASYGKEPYDISVFGRAEVDVRIISGLYLTVSGGYEYGVTPAFRSSNTPFFSESGANGAAILPIVYAGGKNLAYHSFADCISFKRQAIWLSGGLKIKL